MNKKYFFILCSTLALFFGSAAGIFEASGASLITCKKAACIVRGGSPTWYNTTWGFRQKITLNSLKVGSSTTNMSNFPVLINVSATTTLKDTVNGGQVGQTNGQDILFTSSDGTTKLSHEIERYVASTGELVAWVKVPVVSTSTDTNIYVYYGRASAANQQDPSGVWDTNYKGVWHLPNGTTLTANDSTSGANHGTTISLVTAVAGQVDGAGSFNGTTSEIANGTSDTLFTENGAVTISAWINPTSAGEGSLGRIVDRGSSITGPNFGVSTVSATTRLRFGVNMGTDLLAVSGSGSGGTVTLSAWNYVTVTWDGSTTASNVVFYVNAVTTGNSTNTNGATPTDNSASAFRIGNESGGTRTFDGTIDEVRVSNIQRSADWILTEYNNQVSPGSFETFAGQESAPTVRGRVIIRGAR